MKTLRAVVVCLFFVAAVFVASANVHVVEIVYLPAVGIDSTWARRSIHAPLFVVVLGALLVGALLGGATALFEQTRLRLGLRQARKAAAKAADESEEAATERARAAAEIVRLRQELSDARAAASPPDAQPTPIDDA